MIASKTGAFQGIFGVIQSESLYWLKAVLRDARSLMVLFDGARTRHWTIPSYKQLVAEVNEESPGDVEPYFV